MLIVRRANPPGAGDWSFPGGGLDLGESLFHCAEREVMEETGVTCSAQAVLTAVDNVVRDADGRVVYHYAIIDVVCRWRAGAPVPRDDVTEARWADPADAEALFTWPMLKTVIRQATAAWPES